MMARDDATATGLTTSDGRRPRVAIVGGTASGALVATMLAEQFGCAPFSAPDGDAMLALFGENAGVDLVLADLSAPNAGAMILGELARALGRSRALPVLALIEGETGGTTGDFAATLAKPYSPRELFFAMRDCLARLPQATEVGHA